jgi:hypothetical protein
MMNLGTQNLFLLFFFYLGNYLRWSHHISLFDLKLLRLLDPAWYFFFLFLFRDCSLTLIFPLFFSELRTLEGGEDPLLRARGWVV